MKHATPLALWPAIVALTCGCAGSGDATPDLSATATLSSRGQDGPADGAERRPPGPPPEAIEACAGLAAGAACSVALPERTIDGTCRPGPSPELPLACVPEGMPPGPLPHGGPPREAIEACAGHTAGAACTVALPARTIDGTCRPGPSPELPLACVPEGMPPGPPPHGGPPLEAIEACSSLTAGAVCQVALPELTIDGTCRPGPSPELPLACAPAGMPPAPR